MHIIPSEVKQLRGQNELLSELIAYEEMLESSYPGDSDPELLALISPKLKSKGRVFIVSTPVPGERRNNGFM